MNTTPTARRYDQCDGKCTTDCGHCKGAGRPTQPLREGNDTLDLIAPQVRQLLLDPHPHQRRVNKIDGDNEFTVIDLATGFWVRVYVDDATVKLERYDRNGVCYTEAQVDVMVHPRAIAQLTVGML